MPRPSRQLKAQLRAAGASWDPQVLDGGANDYDEHKFYIGSTDGHGHKQYMKGVNLPPNVAGHIQALIAQRKIPAYRTEGDLIRDAVIHRLHWLAENYEVDEGLQRTLALERAIEQVEASQREREKCEEFLTKTEQELRAITQIGNVAGLRAMLDVLAEQIDNLPDPWGEDAADLHDEYRDVLVDMVSRGTGGGRGMGRQRVRRRR